MPDTPDAPLGLGDGDVGDAWGDAPTRGELAPIPPDEAARLLSSLEAAESIIAFDAACETTVVFREAVGVLARRTAGRVVPLDDVADLLRGAVVTHNHPSGRPFTPGDVSFAVRCELAELRVVSGHTAWSLRPGAVAWNAAEWEAGLRDKVDAHLDAAKREVAWSDRRFASAAEQEGAILDLAWSRLAEDGVLLYTRTEVR